MFEHLAGQTFGVLRVTRLNHVTEEGHAIWHVECVNCGAQKTVRSAHLRSGATKTCVVCKRKARAVAVSA
jgi:hypothetical protein